MSIKPVHTQERIHAACSELNADPAGDLNGIGSTPLALSRAYVNGAAGESSFRCCGYFDSIVSGFSHLVATIIRTVRRWIWGANQKLVSLESLNASVAQQGVARDQIVRDFATLSTDTQEIVKLAMWQLASRELGLPADATNSDWAGRVIYNQLRQGSEPTDRTDIAEQFDISAEGSLFRRAMGAVIEAMQGERRGSSELEDLKTLTRTAGVARQDIEAAFNRLPVATRLNIKYSMWALAGRQIDPTSPQPYDRCDEDHDWAGRIIRNEVRIASETSDRADIVRHTNLAADGSLFRQALEIVASGEAAFLR